MGGRHRRGLCGRRGVKAVLERKGAREREPEKAAEVRLQLQSDLRLRLRVCAVWLWCLATVTPVQEPV
jgi:hypothetical protein